MSADPRPTDKSFGFYKRRQAAISRRRLVPVTAFYTSYSLLLLILASRTAHPYLAAAFFLAGVPVWTIVEYLFHRFVLHGRFKRSKKFYKKFYMGLANKYLDPLHWEHHARPTDALHISGQLKDLLPLFAVAVPLSFIFPLYTTPEEWEEVRSEEHTSELQSRQYLVCRLLLEKKKKHNKYLLQ